MLRAWGGLRAEVGRGSGQGVQERSRAELTHHRVAGLKHLTEQDTTLLFSKRLTERIQDTCVPGVESVWALWGWGDKGRDGGPLPLPPVPTVEFQVRAQCGPPALSSDAQVLG